MNDEAPCENPIEPAADHALRVFVERVVRPIRAQETTKLRMRRELYAHAVDAYADEAASPLRGAHVVEQTLRRLGEPVALAAGLQASVRPSERWAAAVDRAVRRQAGEPKWRHALRLGAIGVGVMTLMAVPAMVIGGSSPRAASAAWFLVALTAWFGAAMTFGAWFGDAVRDHLARGGRRAWILAWGCAAAGAGALLVPGWFFVFVISGGRLFDATQPYWNWVLLAGLFAPASLALAWLDLRERRGLDEWLALDLG